MRFPTPIVIREESGMQISSLLKWKKTERSPERTYARDASDPVKLPERSKIRETKPAFCAGFFHPFFFIPGCLQQQADSQKNHNRP